MRKLHCNWLWRQCTNERACLVTVSCKLKISLIFRDEAARMWTKREAEWERERLARERLMAEVQKLCVQQERHPLLCRTTRRRPIVGADHQCAAYPDSSAVDSIWIARGGQNARSVFKGGKRK